MCLDDGWERERCARHVKLDHTGQVIEFCCCGTEEVSASVGEVTLSSEGGVTESEK